MKVEILLEANEAKFIYLNICDIWISVRNLFSLTWVSYFAMFPLLVVSGACQHSRWWGMPCPLLAVCGC